MKWYYELLILIATGAFLAWWERHDKRKDPHQLGGKTYLPSKEYAPTSLSEAVDWSNRYAKHRGLRDETPPKEGDNE